MHSKKIRALGAGYTAEVDSVNEQLWSVLLAEFDDASIYQTWQYAEVIAGRHNVSCLVVRHHGQVAAIALARITRLPLVKLGIAYVYWGPLWRRRAEVADPEIFRQALRALRNEFVCKRGLCLRVFPCVFDESTTSFSAIIDEEGFSPVGSEARGRTILMDLQPSLGDLRDGMNAHWKRELKSAERNHLEIVEGTDEKSFAQFIEIYREMISRKKFVEPNDINQFRLIQSRLPESLKLNVMLCKTGTDICAGAIYSAIGNGAVYLFGATSNAGMKSRGSYALQWRLVEALKQQGTAVYNLNGINPDKNPGTYKFKNDLAGKNGKDVFYMGRFDAYGGAIDRFCMELADALRKGPRKLKQLAQGGWRSRRELPLPAAVPAAGSGAVRPQRLPVSTADKSLSEATQR